jgi:hypothetical protein
MIQGPVSYVETGTIRDCTFLCLPSAPQHPCGQSEDEFGLHKLETENNASGHH